MTDVMSAAGSRGRVAPGVDCGSVLDVSAADSDLKSGQPRSGLARRCRPFTAKTSVMSQSNMGQ